MTDVERRERKHQEHLRRLKLLRPIDDDFMRCLFKDDIPLVQLVLRILTGKPDLIITDCQTQKDMKRLLGARSLCLDAYGTDSLGKKYDIEIQRADKGADPHRARYHASVLDIENLDASRQFCDLPETFTIFITEKDFFARGEPFYPIERINLVTGEHFNDGEHILYVNGEYRGPSDIGRLMHDFNCADAGDMNFKLMADRTRYLKEHPKGVSEVCRLIEELVVEERQEAREEGRAEGRLDTMRSTARRMLALGTLPLKMIAECTGLPLEEVERLRDE